VGAPPERRPSQKVPSYTYKPAAPPVDPGGHRRHGAANYRELHSA